MTREDKLKLMARCRFLAPALQAPLVDESLGSRAMMPSTVVVLLTLCGTEPKVEDELMPKRSTGSPEFGLAIWIYLCYFSTGVEQPLRS